MFMCYYLVIERADISSLIMLDILLLKTWAFVDFLPLCPCQDDSDRPRDSVLLLPSVRLRRNYQRLFNTPQS